MYWFKIKSFIRFYLLAIVTTVLFLIFTLLTFWEVYERVEERNKRLFDYRVQTVTSEIEKRMQDYIQILKGTQGMYQISDTVSRKEWKDYVETLEVEANYPGILGIGYSKVLPEREVKKFEEIVREREYPEFRLWPEGERAVYTSIVFLEPLNKRNLRALGYDMFSDSVRREAMVKARDSGEPALSGMLKLVQETNVGVQNGFILYLPVYNNDQIPQPLTEAERRRRITGYVYSPFRVNDLMEGILGSRFQDISVEIYDGIIANPASLLYHQGSENNLLRGSTPSLSTFSTIQMAGHYWLVRVEAKPEFGNEVNFPWFILGGGLIISTLLFLIMYSVANIRRSTYMNQLITDNATPALLIVDQKGFCTFMNPSAEVLSGYSFPEARGKSFHQLLHHSYPNGSLFPPEECPILQALKSKTALFNHEDIFFQKDGSIIYGSLNSQPIYENRKVVAHLIELRDISQEKQAELSLKESNRNLKTLNNIGRNLSAELELKKLIQLITDSCTELCGAELGVFIYNNSEKKKEEPILFTLSGAKADAQKDFPIHPFTQFFEPDFKWGTVIRFDDFTRDQWHGEYSPLKRVFKANLYIKSFLAVPVISRSGKVTGGLFFGHSKAAMFTKSSGNIVKGIATHAAIAMDNSELFEAINSKNSELVRINNDLDNFVYTASHDLKAPMLNIEGLISALNNALEKNNKERINQIIELIRLSVHRFKDTIQSLTEVSKVNRNLDEDLEKIDLRETIGDIKISISDMIAEAEADIIEDIHCNELNFSKPNMKSLLLNLITNSIKYRKPSQKAIIKIYCRKEEGNLILVVSDNGLGIPENQLSKIFVMFKRYHSHVEGTGVGLYLVKRIAENYGGSVKVESEVDKGTTFTIRIPELRASA